MEDLSHGAAEFYKMSVVVTPTQAAEICSLTAGQDNSKWQRERLLRVTGSKGHSLFRCALKVCPARATASPAQ